MSCLCVQHEDSSCCYQDFTWERMVQHGSSPGINTASYHDSPLRAPSTGNKKEYRLESNPQNDDRQPLAAVAKSTSVRASGRRKGKHNHINIISLCDHYLGSVILVLPSLRPILPVQTAPSTASGSIDCTIPSIVRSLLVRTMKEPTNYILFQKTFCSP